MDILHICSGYPDTNLYKCMLEEIDKKKVNQIMYVPYKSEFIQNKRLLSNPSNTKFIFSNPYNKLDRILYFTKIDKIFSDIKINIELGNIKMVHAHFLFSNGSIAYKLKKTAGIDYVVAVRNTDINYFFKYAIHLRSFGLKILREAKYIIFLSPAYRNFMLDNYIPLSIQDEIIKKSLVIPNGIDDFWQQNKNKHRSSLCEMSRVKLIFIGELNKNKNVHSTIKALKILVDQGLNVQFDIIGKGDNFENLESLIKELNLQDHVNFHGYINDKRQLLRLLRSAHIFVMPSFRETFGLVYIEAMSQGLPIIYTKGQGVDGYFSIGQVGFPVNPNNIRDISKNILKIIHDYNNLSQNALLKSTEFEWNKIVEDYINIYN
ncbi:glycosyltransferase family 4 protein, partial [Sutcliffiella rhizosphaerae]|uniref:glycosyltransferase family 4 protein n=1 Tax=Sutcliffiella rhizosphaerae TaxID=2880967 RepID=UPI001E32D821